MVALNVVDIGDFGLQADDETEQLTILECAAESKGELALGAVIGNYTAAERRARLARSMLDILGHQDIPVGVGFDPKPDAFKPYEFITTYPQSSAPLPAAKEVIGSVVDEADDKSVVFLLHSSLRDAADFMDSEPVLCERKIGRFIIQAGIKTNTHGPALKKGRLQPDDSYNNACDPAAAEYVYEGAQAWGIPTTFISRHAVFDRLNMNKVGLYCMAQLHPVGVTILQRALDAANAYWRAVHALPASLERDYLHTNRDRQYFVDSLLNGNDPGISADDAIDGYIDKVFPYDALAAMAASPYYWSRFFDPYIQQVNDTEHAIVGLNEHTSNIRDVEKVNIHLVGLQLAHLNNAAAALEKAGNPHCLARPARWD